MIGKRRLDSESRRIARTHRRARSTDGGRRNDQGWDADLPVLKRRSLSDSLWSRPTLRSDAL